MSCMSRYSTDSKEELAVVWFECGIFLDRRKSPEGRGFRLKLHERNPDAPLSPFYLNFRLLRSYPRVLGKTAQLFASLVRAIPHDLVADIPTAITPVVAVLSLITLTPMITPRELKTHGTGGEIDGVFSSGQSVALFDDLVTQADSKLQAGRVLNEAGLNVAGIFVLVDREQGGRPQLVSAGYKLYTAWTITDLLAFYREEGMLTGDLHAEILAYLFN